jgi:hypothetical protein
MENIFFFQTQQIPDDTSLFNKLKEQKIFFSYFLVDQKYYLFVYSQTDIQLDTIYHSVKLIEELDSKQRKIRSLRGFFLYALETMEKGKEYEILETNLQPFFWRKVKNIIQQNKKAALQEFLFGSTYGRGEVSTILDTSSSPTVKILEDQIQALQKSYDALRSQVESLQQKIIQLEENQKLNLKKALSELLKLSETAKIDQQYNYTLEGKKDPYLTQNDPKRSSAVLSEIRDTTSRGKDIESKSLSEVKITPVKPLSNTQDYNIPSNEEKALNEPNLITLGKIPEEEQIEIIKTGFQLKAEGKISLKKYYEGTDPNSLVQSKGYSIKYETIRRNKLYQQLKPSNN